MVIVAECHKMPGFTGKTAMLLMTNGLELGTGYPIVVIVEYNSVFGNMHAITVPYNAQFDRTQAHFSNLYWGCSLKALTMLAEKKGYSFVGCNSNGNNAYFIRNDKLGPLKVLSAEEGYVESIFHD